MGEAHGKYVGKEFFRMLGGSLVWAAMGAMLGCLAPIGTGGISSRSSVLGGMITFFLVFCFLIKPLDDASKAVKLDQALDQAHEFAKQRDVANQKLKDWEEFRIVGLNDQMHRYLALMMSHWVSAQGRAEAHVATKPAVNGDFKLLCGYRDELNNLLAVVSRREEEYRSARGLMERLGFILMDDDTYRTMAQQLLSP